MGEVMTDDEKELWLREANATREWSFKDCEAAIKGVLEMEKRYEPLPPPLILCDTDYEVLKKMGLIKDDD